MTGRVVATRRRSLTVELEAVHRTPGGPATITLPTAYVGEHVDYGYARTVDTAQGTTVDHSLFAPSTGSSAERAYVALSRGRLTNRIYATNDRSWIDAIGRGRSHALAVDQTPGLDRTPQRTLGRRNITHDQERPRAARTRPVDPGTATLRPSASRPDVTGDSATLVMPAMDLLGLDRQSLSVMCRSRLFGPTADGPMRSY